MRREPLFLAASLLSGIVFGIGLSVARMIDPEKIKNFLDLATIPSGGWDPSLAFVMGGGLLVAIFGLRLDRLMRKPVAAPAFLATPRAKIDGQLLAGAAIFGVGWGLSGLCPGPAVADLGLVPGSVILFVAAMLVGSWAVGQVLERSSAAPETADVPAE